MVAPIPLPADVVEFIRGAFARCNMRASHLLTQVPNVHESVLDMTFIAALTESSAPHLTNSGYLIDFQLHWIGNGWHFGRWEVADIGVLVTYRRQGYLLRTKAVLLQSKRLYPIEVDFEVSDPPVVPGGFGALHGGTTLPADTPRAFSFTRESRYSAMQVGDAQWQAIRKYEDAHRIPVHYMLYHPRSIPSTQAFPLVAASANRAVARPAVGCRVVSAAALRVGLARASHNYAPSYADVLRVAPAGPAPGPPGLGWRVEDFVADEVVGCREGYVTDDPPSDDSGLFRIFNARTGPISAALRINIDATEEAEALEFENLQG